MKYTSSKKWVITWISTIVVLTALTGAVNFAIDPFGLFNHSFTFNKIRSFFDERRLKSIHLAHSEKEYNALLLGSSRATLYNQNTFLPYLNTFNYAFSAGRSFEYPQFIDFFKEQQNKTPEYLILALDFFDCMVADTDFDQKKERNRETLDLATNSKLELFVKNYFTIDTLIYSFENFKRSILNKHYYRSYNENNVATCDVFPAQSVEDIATTNAAKAYSNSSYDDKFKKRLLEIINANHDSKFIVFTTPLSKPYIDSINSNPKTKELYDRWIEDMVSVFGKIYFTTFHNKLSSEYTKHSFDGTHFYQKACNKIINDIMSYEFNSPEQLSGNVIIINKNNLKQTLNTI